MCQGLLLCDMVIPISDHNVLNIYKKKISIYIEINPTLYYGSLRNCNKFVKDSDQFNKLHILCPKV